MRWLTWPAPSPRTARLRSTRSPSAPRLGCTQHACSLICSHEITALRLCISSSFAAFHRGAAVARHRLSSSFAAFHRGTAVARHRLSSPFAAFHRGTAVAITPCATAGVEPRGLAALGGGHDRCDVLSGALVGLRLVSTRLVARAVGLS